MTVSRITPLVSMVVVLCASHALAQQGHGGPPRPSNDTSIQDFKRAMAVQAAPDQVSDFQILTRNTEDARKQAHDLQQKSAAASDSTGLYKLAFTLKDIVDQVENQTQTFVKGFTKAQTVLLKEHTKKLGKVQSEISKQNKSLDEQLKRSTVDPKQLADLTDRLEKSLADLQLQQRGLADEMGIPQS
jgi:hypothetical protein